MGKQAPLLRQGKRAPLKQVVIASLPGAAPEVYVATLAGAELSLQEAEVHSGEVSVGNGTKINVEGATVKSGGNGEVTVLKAGKQIVALHFETEEEESTWLGLLKESSQARPKASAAKPSGSSPGPTPPRSPARRAAADESQQTPESAGASEELEVARLQARSKQLQGEIKELEAVGARRDKQLQKLMKRMDGSIEMLQAVQDMCNQQRKVIYAQRVAIVELKRECGEPVDENESSPEPAPQQQPQPADEDDEDVDDGEDEDVDDEDAMEQDLEARTQQLMSLLAQAESMQGALLAAQGGGNTDALAELGDVSSELNELMAMMGMAGGSPERR